MIQFVSGNIEQATELMLFNSAEILLKLELYLKNIFQIRSNINTNMPIWYFSNTNTNICVFEYQYKYEYVFGPSPDQWSPGTMLTFHQWVLVFSPESYFTGNIHDNNFSNVFEQGSTLRVVRSSNPTSFVLWTSWVDKLVAQF